MAKDIAISLALAFALSLPITGFFAGVILADTRGSGPVGQFFGRILIGGVFAVLNTLSMGSPPRNEGGVGEPYHLRLYSIAVGAALFCLLFWRLRSDHPAI